MILRIFISLLLLSSLLSACVEDDLEFPDVDTVSLDHSIAIITFLNEIKQHPDDDCLLPIFPITLGYNTDISIEVDTYDGLLEIAENQRSSFHVNQISFPFLMTSDELLTSIDSEEDFIAAFTACEIPTLRERIAQTFNQCYELIYPVGLIDPNGSTQTFNSNEALFLFLSQQNDDYQPDLNFPVSARVFSEDSITVVFNYFDLYEVLNACTGCPEVSFEIEEEFNNVFEFTADHEELTDSDEFLWFVNDKIVRQGNDPEFEETFTSGEYEICLKVINDQCGLGATYCETIEVCPIISFEQDRDGDLFIFTATFPEKDAIEYTWAVYLENDLLFFETEFPGDGDNQFFFEGFQDEKTYTVCLETEDGCSEVTKKCVEVRF